MRLTADQLLEAAAGRVGFMVGGRVGEDAAQDLVGNLTEHVDIAAHKAVGKKRKISKYQKAFGRELKKLKSRHPRTSVKNLWKRAHKATRKRVGR